MKLKTITLSLFIFFNVQLLGQDYWSNYVDEFIINDVLIDGEEMWVGSQGGLTKTNLETGAFEYFIASNSAKIGGGIEEIKKAPDGSLWLGSQNAGIFHVKDGVWTNYFDGLILEHSHSISNLQVLENGDVWFFVEEAYSQNRLYRIREGVVDQFGNLPPLQASLMVLDENYLYMHYYNILYKYNIEQEKVVRIWNSDDILIYGDDNFYVVTSDKNGNVLFGGKNRLLELRNDTITELEYNGVVVYGSFKDQVGNVFLTPNIFDESGVRLIKYDGEEFTYFTDEDFDDYPTNRNPIFKAIDDKGALFALFYDDNSPNLVYRFDGMGWEPFRTQIYPISDNHQYDVESDCEGNLWFQGANGVDVRYADRTWEYFGVEVGPHRNFSANQMTVDPVTCDVWFANNGNGGDATIPGIIKISDGAVSHFLYDQDNVNAIEAAIDGKVYFYSLQSGFGYILDDVVYMIDEIGLNKPIFSIDCDSKGNVYLASWDDGLIKYDGDSFYYYGEMEDGEEVFRVYVDNDDLVWAITTSGLTQFNGVDWISYTDTWPKNSVYDLVQDRKGNFWVTSWFDGLYYWDKEDIQHYTIHNSGLSSNSLRGISLDPDGNIIVTQNIGVTKLTVPKIGRNYRGKGKVYYDSDKDGNYIEGVDTKVPGQKVNNVDEGIWSVTNSDGEYTFYSNSPDQRNFLHQIAETAESTTDNPQFSSFESTESILPDFGFWDVFEEDISLVVSNFIPVCNQEFAVQIYLWNKNVQEVSGSLSLKFDAFTNFIESSFPIVQQYDEVITFSDIQLKSFEALTIKLTFQAPGFEENQSPLAFTADFETASNVFSDSSEDVVLCSYDPNDKKVEATGDFKNDFGLIKDPLKYTIRFQNEGTFKAFDVTLIDTLDADLDPATFSLLASSHRVETNITKGGVVSFVFSDIDLPPKSEDDLGSQGFVVFTVRAYPDVENFTQISNKADIYFDFNPPIVTNTTIWNLVDDLSLVSVTEEYVPRLQIFPNPTDGRLTISYHDNTKCRILDTQGKLVYANTFSAGTSRINLKAPPGVYIVWIQGSSGDVETVKLVIY